MVLVINLIVNMDFEHTKIICPTPLLAVRKKARKMLINIFISLSSDLWQKITLGNNETWRRAEDPAMLYFQPQRLTEHISPYNLIIGRIDIHIKDPIGWDSIQGSRQEKNRPRLTHEAADDNLVCDLF